MENFILPDYTAIAYGNLKAKNHKIIDTDRSVIELEIISDFYMCDIDGVCNKSFTELELPKKHPLNIDVNKISLQDFRAICSFGKIIRDYRKISEILVLHRIE